MSGWPEGGDGVERIPLSAGRGVMWRATANGCVAQVTTYSSALLHAEPFVTATTAGVRLVANDGTVYAEAVRVLP